MKTLGGWLFFFGVGSIVLNFLDMEFRLLMWIDTWGVQTGWIIRIAMAVVGGALWFFGRGAEEGSATSADPG
jgi:hypothetical protein